MKTSLVNGKDIFGKTYNDEEFKNVQNAYKPFVLSKNMKNEPIFTVYIFMVML